MEDYTEQSISAFFFAVLQEAGGFMNRKSHYKIEKPFISIGARRLRLNGEKYTPAVDK